MEELVMCWIETASSCHSSYFILYNKGGNYVWTYRKNRSNREILMVLEKSTWLQENGSVKVKPNQRRGTQKKGHTCLGLNELADRIVCLIN